MPDFIDLALPQVLKLLAQRIGLRADTVGESHLKTAVTDHMDALRLTDATVYAKQLVEHSVFDDLIERVIVPETWFFRDLEPFRCLRGHVTQMLNSATGGGPIRVLSIPCSTGEEPYSIALTLLDMGLRPAQFHVEGVDISRGNLRQAQAARYTRNSFRERTPFLSRSLESYFRFHAQENRYELDNAVRTNVRFRRANLAASDFLSEAAPYHVIFCRNLLIYLTPEARELALRHFQRLLAADGLIYLGHAESSVGSTPVLQADPTFPFAFRLRQRELPTLAARSPFNVPVEQPAPVAPLVPKVATPKPLTSLSPLNIKPVPPGTARTPGPPNRPTSAASQRPVSPPVRSTFDVRGAASGRLKEGDSTANRTDDTVDLPSNLFAAAQQAANAGRLEEAATLCTQFLNTVLPHVDALSLLGTIRQAQGQLGAAEQCFQKALYLDPQHYESLIHLSLLAQAKGDSIAAENFKRRAVKAMPK